MADSVNEYVQYGCGLSAPAQWTNFDSSPTLRLQALPVLGSVVGKMRQTYFPKNVRYGDIVKGLPVPTNSCKAVYCSHVLEHLSLSDFRTALKNTFKILQPGGKFRCVVPDLEFIARRYISDLALMPDTASISFIGNNTLLGLVERPKGLELVTASFGNSKHLWMWDQYSLSAELKKAGFHGIKRVSFNDSDEAMFKYVENKERFENALAIECIK